MAEEKLNFVIDALHLGGELHMDWKKVNEVTKNSRADTPLRRFQEILKEHDYKYDSKTGKVVKLTTTDAPARSIKRKEAKEKGEEGATKKRKRGDVAEDGEVSKGGKKAKKGDAEAEIAATNDGSDVVDAEAEVAATD